MTREEALKRVKGYLTDYISADCYGEVEEIMEALEQQPCEDCISRQAAIDTIESWLTCDDYNEAERHIMRAMESILYDLPPVTPQPEIGKWIKTPKAVMGEGYMWYCDKCEYQVYQDSSRDYPSEKYCPNCGRYMIKPQESKKVNCKSTKCENCINHNYCDFESQGSEKKE